MATSSRIRVAVIAMALSTALVVPLAYASQAEAGTAWWHLSSGSRPSYLKSGSASNETQNVTVSGATGETFVLANLTKRQIENGEFWIKEGKPNTEEGEPQFTELAVGASPSAVQAGLEGIFHTGNVEVTRQPGAYVITFKGSLAYQPVRLLNSEVSAQFGFKGSVQISQVSEGRPDGEIVAAAENVGDSTITGAITPVELKDILPPGFKAVGISAVKPARGGTIDGRTPLPCNLGTLTCTLSDSLAPYQMVELRVAVIIEGGASGSNEVIASGGETPTALVRRPVVLSSQATPFGVEDYGLALEEEGGSLDTQAGSHPFQATTTITLNQLADRASISGEPKVFPAALPKDLNFKWPAGLIGDPNSGAKCSLGQFLTIIEGQENECSPQSAVGVSAVTVFEPGEIGILTFTVPLFNLEPAVGEPARFGFYVPDAGVPVVIDTSVRTGSDYGVNVEAHSISQTAAFLSSQVTVWGVPGDARHDNARGWGCLEAAREVAFKHAPCAALEEHAPPAFISLPTSCSGPLQTAVSADSWSSPGQFAEFPGEAMPALTGCNQLPFGASVKVTPEEQAASSPTGFTVDVHVPQDASTNGNGLAVSSVRDISVTMPEGVTLNPSAAHGLQACAEPQIGYLPAASQPPGNLLFSPLLGSPFCPAGSKVATVKIKTPLLPNALEGGVYLATPAPNHEDGTNPFRSLVSMYLVAEDQVSKTLVKLPGDVSLDQATGRITATFAKDPQVPFEDAEVRFFGGERAPLATPDHCGSYTTSATLTPWSGNEAVDSYSSFNITSGPHGSACPSTLPFAPSLMAGTTNPRGGAFSPLSTTIFREDGDQSIQNVQIHTPPGISGILTGVKLCGEVEANAGTCGAESRIGDSSVSVGVGSDPYAVTGGEVFLTGPYEGAPFGLSIVTPAIAGPFDLGNVVVRAKVQIDPHTAALTVTSDAAGPFAIPHILDGIPLQIRQINVTIDRPGFTFNPTNCASMVITGDAGSTEGASAPVSSPFQAVNCAILKFAPKFSASTGARTSKHTGASLHVKLSYPNAPQGTQTDIAKVKVDLPIQLPSQLKTLQKACAAAVFEANPANCPAKSVVGHANVTTPLLPVPLTGPAYFVSHGGEAFPSLTMVLQGYGITVDLVGSTLIRHGVTSTTFRTVPDVPFSTFELTLPGGEYSALAANLPPKARSTFCGQNLLMPTAFVAQNGAELHQTTKINITGCASPKRTKHAKKPARRPKKR